MRKKRLNCLVAGAMAVFMTVSVLSPAGIANAEKSNVGTNVETPERVSVHDPSIIKDTSSGRYYVFGSHIADAYSDDLVDWTLMNGDWNFRETSDEWKNDSVYGAILENLEESFLWAGYDDGDSNNGGLAVWAPDVIWNEDYKWEDGSTGAYMLYYSASSTWRRSCIGYVVSKNIEGPYSYVDTVVYSGFTKDGATDGNSTRNTKWDNDYLNLNKLIEKGSLNGGISGINDNWFNGDGWNNNYAPNAIDPTLFYDKTGEHLYMTYGSWSGGIFILELDKETGEAIYPGVDSENTEGSGNFTDRYFGTHIAGANHQSGEGPYIVYDAGADYYYLYETYGGLTSKGGYNMRLFRSKDVFGPYVDAAGNNAKGSGANNDSFGIKLMGNYQFLDQPGYRAAGHNSAFVDEDGKRYLVYHQRFDEPENQTERHEVRVHQQFLNEDGWPVTAVYENRNEEITTYSGTDAAKAKSSATNAVNATSSAIDAVSATSFATDVVKATPSAINAVMGTSSKTDVVGSYEIINHGTDTTDKMIELQVIHLSEDGKVSGDMAGTWEIKDNDEYTYITISTGSDTYKGVLFNQYNEDDTPKQVMTFSAIGDNNECIWASQRDFTDETYIKVAQQNLSYWMPNRVSENISLPTQKNGVSISWKSSNEEVFSSDGVVVPQENETEITLTGTFSYGSIVIEKDYNIIVNASKVLIYGFDFDTEKDGEITPIEGSTESDNAVLKGAATLEEDSVRGSILHITNEAGAKAANYLRLPENTMAALDAAGYSVSMWANVGADTFWASALFEANAGGQTIFPMTRIDAELNARINANGFLDATDLTSHGERGVWQHAVYTVSPTGIKVYLNGELVGEVEKDISGCFDKTNDYSVFNAKNVTIGSGEIFGDEDVIDVKFDDFKIYSGLLSSENVSEMYKEELKTEAPAPSKVDASQITVGNLSNQTYTGKTITPALSVSYNGKVLKEGTDYTVKWKNNTNAGKAEVVLTFTGDYTGSITKNFVINKAGQTISATSKDKVVGNKAFNISAKLTKGDGKLSYASSNKKVASINSSGKVTIKKPGVTTITIKASATNNYNEATKKITINVSPKKVSIKSAKSKSKKITVKWKKLSGVSGYEIQYSTNKKFKSAKKVTVKKSSTTSKTISKLKAGKKYYVRVRAYAKSGSSKIYGSYSNAKRISVKK